jgi:hypothetical protein
MIQRQKNGELSLYGYERKLFQGARPNLFCFLPSLNFILFLDLITFVGEPSKPPDPLDPLSVNIYDQFAIRRARNFLLLRVTYTMHQLLRSALFVCAARAAYHLRRRPSRLLSAGFNSDE